MDDIQTLRDERTHLLRTNKDILDKAKKENRAVTEDEQRAIADNMKDAEKLATQIENIQKHEELERQINSQLEATRKPEARQTPPIQITNGQLPGMECNSIEFVRYGKLKAFKRELDAYKSGQWIRANILGDRNAARWCRDHGMDIQARAHSESINTTGGALVPNEFMQTVIDLRDEYGVFRQHARVVPMGRDTMTIPRRAGGLTAYWSTENTAITESTTSWNSVELVAKKLGTYSLLSSELAEDAIIDLAEWLAQESAYAFATKEDQTGFTGDGTSTYNGILGVTKKIEANSSNVGWVDAATGHDNFAEIDASDVTSVMGKLPTYARRNAKFFCSQVCYAMVFERLALSAGGNTIQSVSGQFQPSFMGFPIIITPVLATTTSTINDSHFFLFGDLSLAATMGERRNFTFAQSNDYKFAEDQIAVKATERIDINVHDVGDTSVAGPIVALIGKTS